jgi:hypothetical protein
MKTWTTSWVTISIEAFVVGFICGVAVSVPWVLRIVHAKLDAIP